jgi:ATP-dependent DNA helicase DinG
LSAFLQAVAATFTEDGVIAQATPQFKSRAGQTDMAMAVAETISSGGELVVEAGTGVGKTYAYLVPVLLSGQRALVSTATKALQDQLFSRDIPKLIDALKLPVRVALLKGRGSYLCTLRLSQARQSHDASLRIHMHALSKIETWSQSTRTGDLSELSGLDDRSPVIPLVLRVPTSNRAMSIWHAKRPCLPMLLSSTTICFLQTSMFAKRAWLNCCLRCKLLCLTKRIS